MMMWDYKVGHFMVATVQGATKDRTEIDLPNLCNFPPALSCDQRLGSHPDFYHRDFGHDGDKKNDPTQCTFGLH